MVLALLHDTLVPTFLLFGLFKKYTGALWGDKMNVYECLLLAVLLI